MSVFLSLCFFSPFYSANSYALGKTSNYFPQAAVEVSYYKSPQSQFPSGQASLDKLIKTSVQRSPEQLANHFEDVFYFYNNQKISTQLIAATKAEDLSTSLNTISNLKDIGYFQVLKKGFLKQAPLISSKNILVLPEKTKLKPLQYKNGFILVEYKKQLGFVDISNCISKFDFAIAVYAQNPKTKITEWMYVKNRIFDQLELKNNLLISMNDVIGVYTRADQAIITEDQQILPAWTSLEIRQEKNSFWVQSQLPGHGLVWWKKSVCAENDSTKIVSIDEILKKEISFVSFNPRNPKQAIAAANGVFLTTDGQNWKEISQFKDYSGPVLFFNDYLIYIGNFRSIDGGKTFENYIQTTQLANTIFDKIGYFPKKIQVKKIKTIRPMNLEITLDIGSARTVKLQTPVYSQDWRVVKN